MLVFNSTTYKVTKTNRKSSNRPFRPQYAIMFGEGKIKLEHRTCIHRITIYIQYLCKSISWRYLQGIFNTIFITISPTPRLSDISSKKFSFFKLLKPSRSASSVAQMCRSASFYYSNAVPSDLWNVWKTHDCIWSFICDACTFRRLFDFEQMEEVCVCGGFKR